MLYPLSGQVRHYAWGGTHYLAELTRRPELAQQPSAELWFGDHPSAPALLTDRGHTLPLDAFLRNHHAPPLSFLLKILDVRAPLSLQVHPDKAQAEAGFAREERQGIPQSDRRRLYPDDNHKPEMMVALSDFWLLHGFDTPENIAREFAPWPALAPLKALLQSQGLAACFEAILRAERAQLAQWLAPFYAAPRSQDPSEKYYWLREAIQLMDLPLARPDPGLLALLMLRLMKLSPGQAIEQPARMPHAYLRGQNVEIMARSDNVLRAGLTPKTVAIDELLRVIAIKATAPRIMAAPPPQAAWYRYPSCAQDYHLSLWQAAGTLPPLTLTRPGIALALGDGLSLSTPVQTLALPRGSAAFIAPGVTISGQAEREATLILAQ